MAEEIFLSICIPTYNRSTLLKKCLQSIVLQVGNNPEVEVIVSDNNSKDDTQQVVEKFAGNYSNIRYSKNETNIGGDKNFLKVLSLGRGKYLKLLNDYVEFKEDCLLKMLEIVKKHIKNKEILFFANGVSYLRKREFYYSANVNEYLPVCSFWSTWIGAIGFWNDDFNKMMKEYTFKTKSFCQTELLFESFNQNKSAVTYTSPILHSNEVLNKETGYNFFDLFINSYLNIIIKGLRNDRRISYWTYIGEKNKLFADFIFVWYKKIKIKNNHSIKIDSKGMEAIIFKNYKYNPILYLYLLYMPFYLIGFYLKKIMRNTKTNNHPLT